MLGASTSALASALVSASLNLMWRFLPLFAFSPLEELPESAIFSFKSKPSFHSNLPIKIRINFINNNYIFIQ